jgi:hypothetical protein
MTGSLLELAPGVHQVHEHADAGRLDAVLDCGCRRSGATHEMSAQA